MPKIHLLFALAGVALLCGCDNQTQTSTQKIDVLTQKIFILQQNQSKQIEAIQTQLASLPPLLDKIENKYFTAGQDKALFYHTNTLYFLLTMDRKFQEQFQQADVARKAADALAYYYHTNQTDAVYFSAGQIANALDAQEKRVESNLDAQEKRIEDKVNAGVRQASTTLGDELAKQIKAVAPDKAADKAAAEAEAARQVALEARLTQIQQELDQIKALLKTPNPPAVQP